LLLFFTTLSNYDDAGLTHGFSLGISVDKEMWEAKSDWVHSIIKADFPKQMEKFRLAVDTQ
jgi:hypothetical protein